MNKVLTTRIITRFWSILNHVLLREHDKKLFTKYKRGEALLNREFRINRAIPSIIYLLPGSRYPRTKPNRDLAEKSTGMVADSERRAGTAEWTKLVWND